MSAPLRPLPARPSLEFERKEAKALLRQLRAGDPEALARARARHPGIASDAPATIQLADAQLVLAREYGFASWPKLVRYFEDVERQRHGWKSIQHGEGRAFQESWARTILAEHRDGRTWAARVLAAYVPRFYGWRAEDVFRASITEDDARLAVARQKGFPSWEALLEAAESKHLSVATGAVDPLPFVARAMKAADLAELQGVVEQYPDLLHPPAFLEARNYSLMSMALDFERRQGRERMRPIIEWLESQGLDLQRELDRQLCGQMRIETDKVKWLLERGADPNGVAPNGVPVLEHALIRYWNGEAVDVLAAHATPRRALWIAAGLGDVAGVHRSLDARGRPTEEATRLRPPFDLVGPAGIATNPDPDADELLMEAFFVAMLNGRIAVLEHMVSRGIPLNTLFWDQPFINLAIGNGWTPVVECLVRLGANLDLRGWRPEWSPREAAREMFEQAPEAPERRRIAELCGLDPDAILAERDARPLAPPTVLPKVREALTFAGDDAFRMQQREIGSVNLLVGLMRTGHSVLGLVKAERRQLERLVADLQPRLAPTDSQVGRSPLPLDDSVRRVIERATAIATEERSDVVHGTHLLDALIHDADPALRELLARYRIGISGRRETLRHIIEGRRADSQ